MDDQGDAMKIQQMATVPQHDSSAPQAEELLWQTASALCSEVCF